MSGVAAAQRRRNLIILAGLAAVSALLGAASFLPPAEERPRAEVGHKVLPDFVAHADKMSLVMVTTSEEAYHLVRNADGWVLAEKGSYPVAPARMAELARTLGEITYAQAMTRDEKKFDRIGLGDPATGGTGALLEVGDGGGTSFAKVMVGYRDGRSYVRMPDDLQAWAVKDGVMPPLQRGARWLDMDVAPVASEEIASVDVRPLSGPAYRLAPDGNGGFALAPPYGKRRVIAALAPTMAAEALTRLSAADVAPALDISIGAPLAEHVTWTKDGIAVVVRCWKAKDRFWVTIGAATSEAASAEALARAMAINTRAAGWAFALTELDWNGFATPLAALVE
jgi:hypothetical protein